VAHVLKDGGGGRFTRVGRAEVARIERVEVYAELEEGGDFASFRLRRAAYVSAVETVQTAPSSS
jgi:hypothetical protein